MGYGVSCASWCRSVRVALAGKNAPCPLRVYHSLHLARIGHAPLRKGRCSPARLFTLTCACTTHYRVVARRGEAARGAGRPRVQVASGPR